ncbi:MAG TPA: hypothetical protein VFS05_16050, partial [Gemmatimonadaceae bacterium]|nr:hypothetical protein [Gemmatimonadaceae bacterium]
LVHDTRRGRPLGTLRSDPVPLDEPERAIESLLPRVRAALGAVEWPAARAPAPGTMIPTPPAPPAVRQP